jgi:hypothetical protein
MDRVTLFDPAAETVQTDKAKHYQKMEISWEPETLIKIAKTDTKMICDV